MTDSRDRWQVMSILLGLVVLHFTLRPWLGSPRGMPDFLLLALMIFAIRARPGRAAVAGFTVGILGDAIVGISFGAGALAHTVVGYLQAWGKAVFFPDNVVVTFGFFFTGAWLRDLLVLLSGGQIGGLALWIHWVSWSLLQATVTAILGIIVMVTFRRFLAIGAAG